MGCRLDIDGLDVWPFDSQYFVLVRGFKFSQFNGKGDHGRAEILLEYEKPLSSKNFSYHFTVPRKCVKSNQVLTVSFGRSPWLLGCLFCFWTDAQEEGGSSFVLEHGNWKGLKFFFLFSPLFS